MKDETLQEAFSNWNEISVEPENLLAYRARLKQVMDEEARVREAQLREEAALEKGVEQGENKSIVRMYQAGLSIEAIMEMLQLTEERVRSALTFKQ